MELKKRKTIREIDGSHGLPCAPCRELVVRKFVGRPMGENAWLVMVYSQSTEFGCGNYCVNLLWRITLVESLARRYLPQIEYCANVAQFTRAWSVDSS